MLRDEEGDGGDTAMGSKPAELLREGDEPALRASGAVPVQPANSRERRLDGDASSAEAFRTIDRPLARALGARTRPARAVLLPSCSGLISRADPAEGRGRARAEARGVMFASLDELLVSGKSI